MSAREFAVAGPEMRLRLAAFGRVLLGVSLICDAAWYVISHDVRAAYLDLIGAPHALIWLTAAVFASGGVAIVTGARERVASLVVMAGIAVWALAAHAHFGTGGIGEYPAELHGEVNFKALIVYAAMIGSLLLVYGDPHAHSALVSGRIIVGMYFIVNALWQWYYFDIRVEHILASGGNPALLPVAIGVQLMGGACVAVGRWIGLAAPPLVLILVFSTVLVHGNLSASAPYPPNAQIHQWFVKSAILAGLLLACAYATATNREEA